jgi:CBS domain-containing protein
MRNFYFSILRTLMGFGIFRKLLHRSKSRGNSSTHADAFISCSRKDRLLADYLSILLSTSGLAVAVLERDDLKSISGYLNRLNSLGIYFILIPSTYGKVLSEEGLVFRREIERLTYQRPEFKIILTYGVETDKRLVEMLSDELKGFCAQNIQILNMSPLYKDLVSSSRKLRSSTMAHILSEPITEIMIPVSKLSTVVMGKSTVADVYFKINAGGVRQCIAIDSKKNYQCLRVISVRDLASKVPPGLMKITKEVKEKYEIELDSDAISQELDRVCEESLEDAFGGKQEGLISVTTDATIEEVIELLSRKHDVGKEDPIYISGFPVLDADRRLVGFVSYLEIIEKFIEDQTKFLDDKKTIADIVKLRPEKSIASLNPQARLGAAKLQMEENGYRSLPIVIKGAEGTDQLILKGFVDDIRLKKFCYQIFANELGDLEIEGIMIPVNRLCIAEATGSLKDFIHNFYEPAEGSLPASTFVVCDKNEIDGELVYLLRGTFSYVDLIQAWRSWYIELQSHQKKKHSNSQQPNKPVGADEK